MGQFEFNEAVTASVSFPVLTCIGNIAVFITSLLSGRLDLENVARDVLATNRGPKLKVINGCSGLSTCTVEDWNSGKNTVDVIMLSQYNGTPDSSITEFMTYINYVHDVGSILLQCFRLTSALQSGLVTADICRLRACACIVFKTVDEITMLLARVMPGTLKKLPHSYCLLAGKSCLAGGCHSCDQGLCHVQGEILTYGVSVLLPGLCSKPPDELPGCKERSCFCIPMREANVDAWTKMLITSLRSKDMEARRARVFVPEALEKYIKDQELGWVEEYYSTVYTTVPRVIEILVICVSTLLFKVDGLSGALVARRAVRDYILDSKGTGFIATAFLTKAMVRGNGLYNIHTFQELSFRGGLLRLRSLSFMVGFVNMICSYHLGCANCIGRHSEMVSYILHATFYS